METEVKDARNEELVELEKEVHHLQELWTKAIGIVASSNSDLLRQEEGRQKEYFNKRKLTLGWELDRFYGDATRNGLEEGRKVLREDETLQKMRNGLPLGWTYVAPTDGKRPYFVDHVGMKTTYQDPRIPVSPTVKQEDKQNATQVQQKVEQKSPIPFRPATETSLPIVQQEKPQGSFPFRPSTDASLPLVQEKPRLPLPPSSASLPTVQRMQVEEPKKKEDMLGGACVQVTIALLGAVVAFVGLIVGIIFISEREASWNSLVIAGIPSLLVGVGLLAFVEFMIARGRRYNGMHDLFVGVGIFLIQGALFALIARGGEAEGGAVAVVVFQVLGCIILAIASRIYLVNRLGRVVDIDARFRNGGALSWTAAMFSVLLVSWIGIGIWNIILRDDGIIDSSTRQYINVACQTVIMITAMWMAYESNHGYLMILTTCVNCLTLIIWAFLSGNYILTLIAIILAHAVLSLLKTIRIGYLQVCTSIVLITSLVIMVFIVPYEEYSDSDWIGSDREKFDISLAIWFSMLTFLPSAILHRAPFAPIAWSGGLLALEGVGSYFCWLLVLPLAMVLYIMFFTPPKAESDDKEEESNYKCEKGFRIVLLLSALAMFVSFTVRSYEDPEENLLLLVGTWAISGLLAVRTSDLHFKYLPFRSRASNAKNEFDSKFRIPWSTSFSVLWGMSIVACTASSYVFGNSTSDEITWRILLPTHILGVWLTSLYVYFRPEVERRDRIVMELVQGLMFISLFIGIHYDLGDAENFLFLAYILVAYGAAWSKNSVLRVGNYRLGFCAPMVLLSAMGIYSVIYSVIQSRESDLPLLLLPAAGVMVVGEIFCLRLNEEKNFIQIFNNHWVEVSVPFVLLIFLPLRFAVKENGIGFLYTLALSIVLLGYLAELLELKLDLPLTEEAKSQPEGHQTEKPVDRQIIKVVGCPLADSLTNLIKTFAGCLLSLLDAFYGMAMFIGPSIALFLALYRYHSYTTKSSLTATLLPPVVWFIGYYLYNAVYPNSVYWEIFLVIVIGSWLAIIHIPYTRYTIIPVDEDHPQDTKELASLGKLPGSVYLVDSAKVMAIFALLFALLMKDPPTGILIAMITCLILLFWAFVLYLDNFFFILALPGWIFACFIQLMNKYEEDRETALYYAIHPTLATAVLLFAFSFSEKFTIFRRILGQHPAKLYILNRTFLLWSLGLGYFYIRLFPLVPFIFYVALILWACWTKSIGKFFFAFLYLIPYFFLCPIVDSCYTFDEETSFAGVTLPLLLFIWSVPVWLMLMSSRIEYPSEKNWKMTYYYALMTFQYWTFCIACWCMVEVTEGWLTLLAYTVYVAVNTYRNYCKISLIMYPLWILFAIFIVVAYIDFDYRWFWFPPLELAVVCSCGVALLISLGAKPVGDKLGHGKAFVANNADLMFIWAYFLSFPSFSGLGFIILLGCTVYMVYTKLHIFLYILPLMIGIHALWFGIYTFAESDVLDADTDWGTVTGIGIFTGAIIVAIILLVKREYWVQGHQEVNNDNEWIGWTLKLRSRPTKISTVVILAEEQFVFWGLLGLILISFSGEPSYGVTMLFPVFCMAFGIMDVIISYRTSKSWRRIQGIVLMSIGVISATVINFNTSDRQVIGSVFLILGACIMLGIFLLQLYLSVLRKCLSQMGAAPTVHEVTVPRLKVPQVNPAQNEDRVLLPDNL